jgi:hypothetical protein
MRCLAACRRTLCHRTGVAVAGHARRRRDPNRGTRTAAAARFQPVDPAADHTGRLGDLTRCLAHFRHLARMSTPGRIPPPGENRPACVISANWRKQHTPSCPDFANWRKSATGSHEPLAPVHVDGERLIERRALRHSKVRDRPSGRPLSRRATWPTKRFGSRRNCRERSGYWATWPAERCRGICRIGSSSFVDPCRIFRGSCGICRTPSAGSEHRRLVHMDH